jgi:hypothetical protein
VSIDNYRQAQTQTATAALVEAADTAGYASSLNDVQPWRWRVDAYTLDLYAEPTRQPPDADPDGRLMVLSCGVALHHARTALAAHGWQVDIDRMPDAGPPRLLARLRLTSRTPVTREALQRLKTIRGATSVARPGAVGSSDLDAIQVAIENEGARLHPLSHDDALDLGGPLNELRALEHFDAQADTTTPTDPPEGMSVYAILCGADDTPTAWLRGGEALSAAAITAHELGIIMRPLIAPTDLQARTTAFHPSPQDRCSQPFLVLRLDHGTAAAPQREHRPGTQSVEMAGQARSGPR